MHSIFFENWMERRWVGYLKNDPPRVVVVELHSPAKHWSAQILGIKNDYFIAELELTGKDAAVNSSIFGPRVGRCMLPDIAILDPLILWNPKCTVPGNLL